MSQYLVSDNSPPSLNYLLTKPYALFSMPTSLKPHKKLTTTGTHFKKKKKSEKKNERTRGDNKKESGTKAKTRQCSLSLTGCCLALLAFLTEEQQLNIFIFANGGRRSLPRQPTLFFMALLSFFSKIFSAIYLSILKKEEESKIASISAKKCFGHHYLFHLLLLLFLQQHNI